MYSGGQVLYLRDIILLRIRPPNALVNLKYHRSQQHLFQAARCYNDLLPALLRNRFVFNSQNSQPELSGSSLGMKGNIHIKALRGQIQLSLTAEVQHGTARKKMCLASSDVCYSRSRLLCH